MSSPRAFAFAFQVLFVLAICLHIPEATAISCPPPPQSPTNTFVVYVQAIFANGTNNNATATPVAGIQGKAFSLAQFGTIYVDDDSITTTASPTSTVLGRAQGTLTATALDGSRFQVSITFVFTAGIYSGSTLVLFGSSNAIPQVSQVAVIGGTNNFTYATGFAEFQPLGTLGAIQVIKTTVTYKNVA